MLSTALRQARLRCPSSWLPLSSTGMPMVATNRWGTAVVGVDGAGHWLHHNRLDEFLRIAREFRAGDSR